MKKARCFREHWPKWLVRFFGGTDMSKQLFVLLLCGALIGSVAAEQEVASQALISVEQAAEVAGQNKTECCVVRVEITQDSRLDSKIKAKNVFPNYEAAEFKVCNAKSVEVILVSGQHGYVVAEISIEKPEFIAALRAVAPENQEKLTDVVIEVLREFLHDETTVCSDEFYEQYEQKIALGIQDILNPIVFELEGAQALVKVYQDLEKHICVIIDQEIDAVSPEMSPAQASWEIGANICNVVIKFFKNIDLESRKIENHPLSRIPMEVRFAGMNALNQAQQNFMMSSMQCEDLQEAGQVLKDFYKNLPTLVFRVLKDFYPALDEAILKQ